MCEEVWCVELGQEGLALGWGNCLKYLKRRWKGKAGRANKDFKMGGGKLGQRVDTLKRRGELEPPYEL